MGNALRQDEVADLTDGIIGSDDSHLSALRYKIKNPLKTSGFCLWRWRDCNLYTAIVRYVLKIKLINSTLLLWYFAIIRIVFAIFG